MNKTKIKDKSKGFLNEFKVFIQRGNAFDMAVAVIIGNAFSKIVSSLVDNILMPLISLVIGAQNFTNLSFTVGKATIKYGEFIQNIVDFLIIAFCIFLFIKLINKFFHKEEPKKEEVKEEPKKDENTILLEEIRDLLKKNKK